jgi:hypothetical protein
MVLDTVKSILYGRRVPREPIVVDQSTEPNRSVRSLGNVGARSTMSALGRRGWSEGAIAACAVPLTMWS